MGTECRPALQSRAANPTASHCFTITALWQRRVGIPPDREANFSHYRRCSETDESLLETICMDGKAAKRVDRMIMCISELCCKV